MFQQNTKHQQRKMFTAVDQLPKTARKLLEGSWAQTFYDEYFCRIDETVFSVLYSDKKSRPNTPVNILMGFETLKSGFGWSDEELYNHFLFDLQVRYALGLQDFDEEYFDLRTIYYFRGALCEYERKHNDNLIQKATEKITDKQIEKFKIKTGLQRMDSTQIQSNIQNMSRIQLLVEIIHRIHRILFDEDKEKYKDRFSNYIKEDALHFVYRLKRDEAKTRLEEIGEDLAYFVGEFKPRYHIHSAYKNLERVFKEHYRFEEKKIVVKKGKELNGATLQSPDDTRATYRKKNGEGAKGYVANITETCDADNSLQLITNVNLEPNITDDQKLMADDLDNLAPRTDIGEIVTDAGYIGRAGSEATEKHDIKHSVTALKGRKRDEDKFGLDDFKIEKDEEGLPVNIECPNGITGEIKQGKPGRYSAGFDSSTCEACPFKDKCFAKKLKKKDLSIIRFTDDNIRVALQRQQFEENKDNLNIRASVESTVRSVIHPFGGHLCKLPVRGIERIKTMTILSAAMVNIRRITGYLSSDNEMDGLLPARC
ncbi:MAG: transposase [Spirochaetota bacterium]|nr:transposase [Spirochaetota bacterium]